MESGTLIDRCSYAEAPIRATVKGLAGSISAHTWLGGEKIMLTLTWSGEIVSATPVQDGEAPSEHWQAGEGSWRRVS
jgi:hypothetical protein